MTTCTYRNTNGFILHTINYLLFLYQFLKNFGGDMKSQMDYDGAPQAVYGFTVSDINAEYQDLSAKGVAVGKVSNYAGNSFSFMDPDGNRIELWGDYPLS